MIIYMIGNSYIFVSGTKYTTMENGYCSLGC